MKFAILFLTSATLISAEMTPKATSVPALTNGKSVIVIDPKIRANDYVQAFDFLRKDRPTLKIALLAANGIVFQNVTELSTTKGGTLLFVKYLSTQGPKTQVLPVEELMEIVYSPT